MLRVKDWAQMHNDNYERMKEHETNEMEMIESIEKAKVSVGLRLNSHNAEMLRMFAEKYNNTVSGIGSELLSTALYEAIETVGEDLEEWQKKAIQRLISKGKEVK